MMNDLNSAIYEGRVDGAPIFSTTDDKPRCEFVVASDRHFKQDDRIEKETSYISVIAHRQLARTCADVLKAGRGVRVVGRLKEFRWTDSDDRKCSQVKLIAEHVEFKPRAKED